jgi:hypothetical protein
MREVHAVICREARYCAPGHVLVVVQLRIEEALLGIGNLPGNIELAHHRDRWGAVRSLMVIGRTMPPSSTIARMTEALTGTAMPERGYRRAPAWRELADGAPEACEAWAYPDPVGEALRWQACEAEVVQIIGRARGAEPRGGVGADRPAAAPAGSALELSPADRMLAAQWGDPGERRRCRGCLSRAVGEPGCCQETFRTCECPQPLMVATIRRGKPGQSWCRWTTGGQGRVGQLRRLGSTQASCPRG